MNNKLPKIVATFGYCGCSPIMPGTVGTLGATVLYGGLLYLDFVSWPLLLTITLLASALNIWIAPWAQAHFGCKDPKQVVIDEVAGYFLTVTFFQASWAVLVGAFVLFRLFDITKPYPIKKFERFAGGWGILLDDLLAGVFAALSLFALDKVFVYLDVPLSFPLW